MAPTFDELSVNFSLTDSIQSIKRENLGGPFGLFNLKGNVVICCLDINYNRQIAILTIITVLCVIIAIAMYSSVSRMTGKSSKSSINLMLNGTSSSR